MTWQYLEHRVVHVRPRELDFNGGKTEKRNGKHIKSYDVATISRLLKIIGLFCKRAL